MHKLLIIKTGTTYDFIRRKAGDFDDMIIVKSGLRQDDVSVCAVHEGHQLPELDGYYAVIITGSHDMVTDLAEWSIGLSKWIREKAFGRIPMLSICYAHQLTATALGGMAGYHPGGVEMGTSDIQLTVEGKADPLMQGLPDRFPVHVTHAQTVKLLPQGASVLARNHFEPHQAVAFGKSAWGVQFHPEFTAEVVCMYIDIARNGLERKGYDTAKMLESVRESPYGELLLKQFIKLAVEAAGQKLGK